MRQTLSLNDIGSVNYNIISNISSITKKTFSLNNIESIDQNIFTKNPPISYGCLLNDKQYTTKHLRKFIIKRYYKHIQ